MIKKVLSLDELLKMNISKLYFNNTDTSQISTEIILIKNQHYCIGICNNKQIKSFFENRKYYLLQENHFIHTNELTYLSIYCIIIDIKVINCNIEEITKRYVSGGKNMNEDNNFVEFSVEEEETYSNDDLYNINSWGVDFSFREIVTMYDENELIKPELQRKYVWTKNEASRFIDSILLGLPVPSIFLAKTSDSRFLIVDGYQRIMTVHDFINGLFGADSKSFKLSNTDNINKRWRSKTFVELSDEEKRRIKTTAIHAIIFEQKFPTNDTAMYQIFERINTGGKTLRPQEIRNCVYQGDLNTLLFQLNRNDNWRHILRVDEDSRMGDLELILRFFAIIDLVSSKSSAKSQIVLNKFLNTFMGNKIKMTNEEIVEYSTNFSEVMKIIDISLDDYAFRKLDENNQPQRKINASVFEAVSIATLNCIKKGNEIDTCCLKEKYKALLNNDEFVDICTNHTTKIENIYRRISIASQILFGIKYDFGL